MHAITWLLVCLLTLESLTVPSHEPPTEPYLGDRFYFDRCPECRRLLGTRGDAIERWYDLRHVRFCHSECVATFEADPAAGFARLDAMMRDDQLPLYPLSTCLVSGVVLPDAPVDFIFRNRLIRLADDAARERFIDDPARYWALLDEAIISHQSQRYWITKCPEQGTEIDPRTDFLFTVVCAQRIVHVCCDDCHDRVKARPSQYLPLIDSALRNPPAGFKPKETP
jgi:hypothetical protein